MKLAEKISTSYGLKESDPFIYRSYFPTPKEDYILYENNCSDYNKSYVDFDELAAISFGFLAQNKISTMQLKINPKDASIFRCKQHPPLTFSQVNHLIEFSRLVITNNPYTADVANYLNVPNVLLCREGLENLNKPKYTNTTKTIQLIDNLFPEVICNEVLRRLDIESIISKINPIRCGKDYREKSIICIPDFDVESGGVLKQDIVIRADLHFDEKNIFNLVANNKSIIVTNRELNPKGLCHPDIIKNLKCIHLQINHQTPSSLIKTFQDSNVNIKLFTKDADHLNEIRLKYIDYEIDFNDANKNLDILKDICNNKVYYKSSKVIVSDKKQYSSIANWKSNKSMNSSEFEEIFEPSLFAEELEDFKLFTLND